MGEEFHADLDSDGNVQKPRNKDRDACTHTNTPGTRRCAAGYGQDGARCVQATKTYLVLVLGVIVEETKTQKLRTHTYAHKKKSEIHGLVLDRLLGTTVGQL